MAREKGWTCSSIQAIHTMLTLKMRTSNMPLMLRSQALGSKMRPSAIILTCQFDPHPRLKHVVGNLQLGVDHDPVVQRHKQLQHHF